MPRNRWLAGALTTALFSLSLVAQETGSLRIAVIDPSGAGIADAQVLVTDDIHGTRRVVADESDKTTYLMPGLDAGLYRLEVSKAGFRAHIVEKLRLHARSTQALRIELQLSTSRTDSVTVTAEIEGISTDPSAGTSVNGQYLSNLPVNSRGFDSLLTLAPGVTNTGEGPGGGIHANGLRSNTNYYMVDGVSANTGVSGGGPAAGGPGRGGPGGGFGGSGANGTNVATNASGSSANLISLDAIQELQVQTSTFAPEFGRSPGAQISIRSRGGTGEFHGAASEYFRDSSLNAADWFNNQNNLGRGTQRLTDTSVTLGGPVPKMKDNTFFFAAIETSHLEQPHTEINTVPDKAVRTRIRSALAPFINAFPLPNGPSVGVDVAEFNTTYSTPSTWASESIRFDRVINLKASAFLRYSRSPSIASNRGGLSSTANSITKRVANTQSLTGSYTWVNDDEQIHNLRVNATQTVLDSNSSMDEYGGAKILSDSLIFPSGADSSSGAYSLNVSGAGGYSTGNKSSTAQNQINVIFDESGIADKINAKIGIDYRLLMPTYHVRPYTQFVSFNGVSNNTNSLLSGTAQSASVSSNVTDRYPIYHNFAAYYQHAAKTSRYTTLTYGLRWDVNPAPSIRRGAPLLGLDKSNELSSSEPLYQTRWLNIAPRFGIASEIGHSPHHELIFRAGVGLFYDTGYGATASAFNNPPYSNTVTTTQPSFPLSADVISAPVLPPTKPYGVVTGADASLKSPTVYEYNITFEKHLGSGRILSGGYMGSQGSNLLTTRSQSNFYSTSYSLLQLTSNGGKSEYNAVQAQYRQTVGRVLNTQFSYTLGHSTDTQSNDSGFAGFAIVGGAASGDSNYDMRHSMSGTATLAIPYPAALPRLLRPVLGDWYVDTVVSAHSSLPFEVQSQSIDAGSSCPAGSTTSISLCQRGFASVVRPNLTGKALWISDPGVPGGRRLNVAAFSVPTSGQGNQPRNGLRGFNFGNADISVRKQFRVGERVILQFRADGYNALNHANFANPSPQEGANLANAKFGIATRMLYNGFGGGSVQSSGAPRSVQLSIRAQF